MFPRKKLKNLFLEGKPRPSRKENVKGEKLPWKNEEFST